MQKHITNFIEELKIAFKVATFDQGAMHKVAHDQSKTNYAIAIIVVAALLGVLGQSMAFWGPDFSLRSLTFALWNTALSIGAIFLASFVAQKFFHGKASHGQFFRVAAYAMVVGFLGIFPALMTIAGLWELALLFVIIKAIHSLDNAKAIGTILVTIVALFLISWVVNPYAWVGSRYMMHMNYFSL